MYLHAPQFQQADPWLQKIEAQIQQAIGEIAGTRTIIAIAHRLSTIRNADVILVFEKGRIVQSGSHAELIGQEGLYRRLCQVQEVSEE